MKNKVKNIKKVLLVWGWTWGHAVPLVNLYNFFNLRSEQKNNIKYDFIWVGESNSIEEKLAKQNDIKFKIIKSWKLRRYFSFQNFIDLIKFIYWIFQSVFLIFKIKPDFIFSKWWYVALPVMIAWKILWKKIFLHESDSIPWLANKIWARFSDKVFLNFSEAKKYFYDYDIKKNKNKYILSGPILSEIFLEKAIKDINIKNKKNILVICWSQWSTLIFKNIIKILEENILELQDYNFRVILGTKNSHFRKEFNKFKNVKLVDFCTQEELVEFYKESNIAITRWSSTMFELALFKIKMIIIPFKYAWSNHQELNARVFEKFWHIVIKDDDLNKNILKESIKNILNKDIKFNNFNKNWLDIIYKTIWNTFE